jgi:molecular chaperone GrpE
MSDKDDVTEGEAGEAQRVRNYDPDRVETEADEADPGDTPGHIDEVAPPAEETLDPEAEFEALKDRHLRLAAEFENYRRRTRREMLEAGEAARAELARGLLEIIDDLTRVAEAPCDPEQHQAMHDGVGLIARKLVKTLSDAGMESVNPLGERFDPNYHEAIILTPTDDPDQDELVSQVLLTGYRVGDRLLRPAQVAVFRHDEKG